MRALLCQRLFAAARAFARGLVLLSFLPGVYAFGDAGKLCGDAMAALAEDRQQVGLAIEEQLARMDPKRRAEGYIEVDSSAFFPVALTQPLHRHLCDVLPAIGTSHAIDIPLNGNRVVNNREILTAEQVALFRAYADLVIASLEKNSWGERFEIDQFDLRAGTTTWPLTTGNAMHRDGSYMTVTVGLLGTGTIYRGPDGALTSTPRGQTLIINGSRRTREFPNQLSLEHRAPNTPEDRLVLIIRLRRAPSQ